MAQRQMTLTFEITATPDASQAAAGKLWVMISGMLSGTPPNTRTLQFGRRLFVNSATMKYVDERGQDLWDVSPTVFSGTASQAYDAIVADMAAATAAGKFDL